MPVFGRAPHHQSGNCATTVAPSSRQDPSAATAADMCPPTQTLVAARACVTLTPSKRTGKARERWRDATKRGGLTVCVCVWRVPVLSFSNFASTNQKSPANMVGTGTDGRKTCSRSPFLFLKSKNRKLVLLVLPVDQTVPARVGRAKQYSPSRRTHLARKVAHDNKLRAHHSTTDCAAA